MASARKLYEALASPASTSTSSPPEDGSTYQIQADNRQVAVDYIADWLQEAP